MWLTAMSVCMTTEKGIGFMDFIALVLAVVVR